MTKAEQDARRVLKRERNDLQRRLTAGQIAYLSSDQLPTRWSHARRARASAHSLQYGSGDLRSRLGAIDLQLKSRESARGLQEHLDVLD